MFRKSILILSVILATASVADAQKKQRAKVVCGPYVQHASTTGFTVSWETDLDAVAWVEIAPDDGTHFYGKERQKFYDLRGQGVHPIGKIHHIKVDGLTPGTKYRYRIMSRGVISYEAPGRIEYMRDAGTNVHRGQPYVTSTLKESYDTLRFEMYNDIHGQDSILNVLMKGRERTPDFVFINGDMTSNIIKKDMIRDMYLKTISKNLEGTLPLFMSRGNHELRGRDAIKWFDYFQTPTGSPYYAFSIGKFFFVVVDACEDKPDSDIEYCGIVASEPYMERQEKWLKEVMESEACKNAEVRIAFCHVPPVAKGWYGNVQVCERLVPALNKADIDLMLCGHIHKWRVTEPDGTVSNAEFPVICNPNIQRMEITATGNSIGLRTVDKNGKVTHTHTINLK